MFFDERANESAGIVSVPFPYYYKLGKCATLKINFIVEGDFISPGLCEYKIEQNAQGGEQESKGGHWLD